MAGQHEVRLKPDTTNLGVTNGEDVKEYYFYLDNTPTHSYARMLYKYPQVAYPYAALVEENRRRGPGAPEFELFDAIGDAMREGRYFDVFIEYAKAGPEDILCRVRAVNRGPDPAPIHILPQLWFRNTHYLFPQLTARANEHRCGGCACGDTRPTSARYVGRVSRSAPAEGLTTQSVQIGTACAYTITSRRRATARLRAIACFGRISPRSPDRGHGREVALYLIERR